MSETPIVDDLGDGVERPVMADWVRSATSALWCSIPANDGSAD